MKNKEWLKGAKKDLERNASKYSKREAKETLKALGWIGAIGFAVGRLFRHAEYSGFNRGAESVSKTVHGAIDKQLKEKEEAAK